MSNLTDKVAVITGGSRGIGRAIALRLAREGAAVAVNYTRNAAQAEQVADAIAKGGGKSIAVQADVRHTADVRHLFETAAARLGPVGIVVSNAGVALPHQPAIVDTTDEEFDSLFAVNTRGTFMVLREAARRLREGGRIITLSSTVIPVALPGYAVYAGTKAAVELFTRILSKELAGRNITVNAVAPGPVETELFNAGKSEETKQRMAETTPLKRIGQPEDIADLVAFLAGPEGGWVNGQVIRANGGMA